MRDDKPWPDEMLWYGSSAICWDSNSSTGDDTNSWKYRIICKSLSLRSFTKKFHIPGLETGPGASTFCYFATSRGLPGCKFVATIFDNRMKVGTTFLVIKTDGNGMEWNVTAYNIECLTSIDSRPLRWLNLRTSADNLRHQRKKHSHGWTIRLRDVLNIIWQ